MSSAASIRGGCHCGAIRYELKWPGPPAGAEALKIPARRCSCSFCTRVDGTWTSHPDAQLLVHENQAARPARYRFATATADFIFCSRCGTPTLVTSDLGGKLYAVVNVNTFDEDQDLMLQLEFSDSCFDGESVEQRLQRRRERWVGEVRFSAGPAG